jgi:hypothetical protein
MRFGGYMNRLIRNEVIDTTNAETIRQSCENYIGSRVSCYEFRSIRYEAVTDKLIELGLKDGDTVTDLGAGDGEFGIYLKERGLNVIYKPVDGMIDGTDLNLFVPEPSDFIVSIEVIEHLLDPRRFMLITKLCALKGVVMTTPNPKVTDVYAMDATHISEVHAEDFKAGGFNCEERILFFEPEDSLLAWA